MVVDEQKETLGFQAEVKQLLKLVVNSLYSNKEIFLRELVSNSSDAIDKLRFTALEDNALYENDPDAKIIVDVNKEAQTITVKDNGIGMSREEIMQNLGTIAKSGTREFFNQLTGDQSKDSQLIGQFGVGFYSAFIIADKIEVRSRRAGMTPDNGVLWISDGSGEYTVENIHKADRGTEVILHVKAEDAEYLESWKLRSIITKYSDHIAVPIEMEKPVAAKSEDDKEAAEAQDAAPEYEVVNQATALWTLPKRDIEESQYKELYKHIAHDWEDPLLWSLNKVEGKLEYTSLLYIPSHAPFDLYNRETPKGLKLYVRRVFIMDDAEQLLPMYLRFVKGIVDTSDLPLNVSREILQSNRTIENIKSAVVKRVLSMLSHCAENEKEKYSQFWRAFGSVMKEGVVEDFSNKEKIAKLLRFATTHNDKEEQTVSLDDYISRMQADQDKIYYVTAETFQSARFSPHLEIFREKGIEVLLLYDNIDEWLVGHLTEYEGKQLQSVAKGDLGDIDKVSTAEQEAEQKDYADIVERVQTILGERVKEVRLTHRLTKSPSCIVADETDMTANMQRILQSVGQEAPQTKPIFELNPKHDLVKRLQNEVDEARFKNWVEVLFDQAVLTEGGTLPNAAEFVQNMNKLLEHVSMIHVAS